MLSKEKLDILLAYLDDIDNRCEDILGKSLNQQDKILASLLSFIEETWELNEEIKSKLWLAFNKQKRENYSEENLKEECFDVFVTYLMLLKSLGVESLDDVIEKKIEKNNKRGY